MEAGTTELFIYRGATADYEFAFVDDTDAAVPFPAGSEAYLQVRGDDLGEPPWLDLKSTGATPALTVDEPGGVVTLHLTPAQTGAIDATHDWQTGVFDLLIGTATTDLQRWL